MAGESAGRKLEWWILGALAGFVSLGGTAWVTHVSASLAEIRIFGAASVERVSSLEAHSADTAARLARIEDKLDRVLERK